MNPDKQIRFHRNPPETDWMETHLKLALFRRLVNQTDQTASLICKATIPFMVMLLAAVLCITYWPDLGLALLK